MLAAPKRQVQHQATAGRAVLRNARRDSCGFTKGSERIWRAQELLLICQLNVSSQVPALHLVDFYEEGV